MAARTKPRNPEKPAENAMPEPARHIRLSMIVQDDLDDYRRIEPIRFDLDDFQARLRARRQ